MNQKDQIKIARDITTGLLERFTTLVKTDRIPEDWDGIEIRQFITDACVHGVAVKMDRKRAKAFRNHSFNLPFVNR